MNSISHFISQLENQIFSLRHNIKRQKISFFIFVLGFLIFLLWSFLFLKINIHSDWFWFWIFGVFLGGYNIISHLKKFQNLRKEEVFLRICLEKFVQIQNSKNHIYHEDFHHLELLEQKISYIRDESFHKKLQIFIQDLQDNFSRKIFEEKTEKSLRFTEIENLLSFSLQFKSVFHRALEAFNGKENSTLVLTMIWIFVFVTISFGFYYSDNPSIWIIIWMFSPIFLYIFLIFVDIFRFFLKRKQFKKDQKNLQNLLFDFSDSIHTLYALRYSENEKNFDEILSISEKIFNKISVFDSWKNFMKNLTPKSQENVKKLQKISFDFTFETLKNLQKNLENNIFSQEKILHSAIKNIEKADSDRKISELQLQKSRLEMLLQDFQNISKNL